MKRRHLLSLASAAAGSMIASPGAQAQGAYPDRPITLVVAAPPGGGTDIVGRIFAEHLSKELGQQVIVDNKGGGNGNIATALVAKAKPDGYTLLMQYSSFHSANPAMIKNLNWSPKDLTGVAMGAIAPQLIVIAKKVPADTLKDFIAYAKAHPGKLNYASFGPGSVAHIGGVLLNKAAGMVVAGASAPTPGDRGGSELDALRSLVRCNVCRAANKDSVITRCMHVFCRACVDERLESRNRKCPQCATVFAASDVRPIYFA